MPPPNMISPTQLSRLIGQPDAPVLIDVRIEEDHALDRRTLSGSISRHFGDAAAWAVEFTGRRTVIVCQRGLKLSQGAAAWLRHEGVEARSLKGGFEAWATSELPLVRPDLLPPRDAMQRTVWVTRARPKIDRIFWSHRGDFCTFDVMLDEFGLHSKPLDRLALIDRGADTARPDLAPEVPGLLAASLGLSRMFSDDLAQLEAGLALYDVFYRRSRDATDETHNWPAGHVSSGPARDKTR